MPRNVKDSDDEVEIKGGRRTRAALNPSVMDSPLRRSTRIKQPTSQDVSSPESVSDVSSIGGTRNTRRRTTTGDTAIRPRRNSVASDISELTETESLPDGPPRRITRRSVAGIPSVETPTKLNSRTRRATRAGSETKSTPPVVRATRRTRASSMEPEISEEPNLNDVGTPIKSRKRASVMPSEPAVAEESDEGKNANVAKTAENTVYEVDENESEALPQSMTTPSRQKAKSDDNESEEKMEVDASPVKGTEADAIEQTIQEATESATDVSEVSRKLEDSVKIIDSPNESAADNKAIEDQNLSSASKGSSYTIENILNNSSEKQEKSPGNKENEGFNSSVESIEKNGKLADNDVRLLTRKSFLGAFTKFVAKRRSISSDDPALLDSHESKTTAQTEEIAVVEISTRSSESVVRKEHLAANCVVLIEPMDINQVDKVQTNITTESSKTNESNSMQNHEEQIEESEKAKENNDDASQKDIVDNNSSFKISNVVSMATEEEKPLKENEATDEKNSNKIENPEKMETIDLESDVTNERDISLINISEDDEETCTEKSNIPAETLNPRSSITNEKPQENEENSLSEIVKGKSSIVTESAVTGTNVEETSGLSEERNDKSGSDGSSPKKVIQDVEAKSPQKKKETPAKVLESDEESDYNGFPAFQDIPADEWTGKRNEEETNSVHSASTERNENEYEIRLVDEEVSVDKFPKTKKQEKSDYDTDDTLIVTINKETKENKEMEVIDEEMPMDLSSDADENVDGVSKSPKKRASLATPRKSIGFNKNESIKESQSPLNVSRRKSSNIMEVESTNSENPVDEDSKLNRSSSKSPKKRTSSSTRLRIDSSSDSEEEKQNVSKIQNANRKSIETSAKKLDSSRINISANNTPNKSSGTPAKRRSFNQIVADLNGDGSNESNDSENQNNSQSNLDSGLTQSDLDEAEACEKVVLEGASKQQEKRRSSVNKIPEESELSRGSPLNSKERNTSIKAGSAKKSLNRSSQSKISEASLDSESDDENSISKYNVSSKSEDAKSSKNNSLLSQENSDSENQDSKQVSSNRKSDAAKLDKSATFGSAKKSKGSQETPSSPQLDVQNKLNNSAKSGSAKKSKLNKSNSEENDEDSKETPASPEEENLNKSTKPGSVKKSKNAKNNSKTSQDFSDSEMEVDDSKNASKTSITDLREKLNKSGRKSSLSKDNWKMLPLNSESEDGEPKETPNKSIKDKNYSTIAQVNSDSESMVSSSSDEEIDATSLIPQFFFDQDTTSSSNSDIEEEESSDTIDSDVARDLNLHGKSKIDYSDDDVPADDCMATESESSDSDDDGADLMDFVVEDDEDDDSFEDVAMELGANDDQSDDSYSRGDKKQRKRIIPRPGGDSDSDESEDNDVQKIKEITDVDKSAIAKTPKKDDKLNKTPKIIEPETPTANLNVSLKAANKKNKNLLLQSSTPKGVRESLLVEKSNTPKAATPLNKSLKQADSSLKKESIQISSAKKESVQTSSAKKLSKSVCETDDTPTKLGSSFKVKTPKSASTTPKQLQTSLPTDLSDSASKSNLSKTKSTKVSTLHQTMMTPNTESPEKRFLMKEKLNDSCPALKIQQKAKEKASRRSTLDNLREEIALIDEDVEVTEEQAEKEIHQNKEVENVEKKKKKKKKQAKNVNTSTEANETLGTSKETANAITTDDNSKSLDTDASQKISKKKNKKKKITEIEELTEQKSQEKPTKEKKKKTKENLQDLQIKETDKKDKKKNKPAETLDEIEVSVGKKDKKKKKQPDIIEEIESKKDKKKKKNRDVDEIEAIEVSKKDKKRKHEKNIESLEPSISKKQSRRVEKNVASDSDDEPEAINFTEARAAALIDRKKLTESIKAGREAKKNKHQPLQVASSKEQRKIKTQTETGTSKTNLKRLPDELLDSLSSTIERPNKRRKIAKAEKILPSRTMLGSRHQLPSSPVANEGYIPLSGSGGTTQFEIAVLSKAKKPKKAVAAASFRERMLARNPRQPISAYLMYQQKQKASGKDRLY